MARAKAYKLEAKFYGDLRGTKIYYTKFPTQPKFLKKKGNGFAGLKHLLQILGKKFKKFKLVITADPTGGITKNKKTHKIVLPAKAVKRIPSDKMNRTRDVLMRIGNEILHENFPSHFPPPKNVHFRPGAVAELLSGDFDARSLNAGDRAALTSLMGAEKAATVDIETAYKNSRNVQLIYLDRLIAEFEKEIPEGHNENWWQSYFAERILFFQDSYIRLIQKLNINIGMTKYPDFIVISSDGYLDLVELKTPDADLLKEDKSRSNWFWSTEVAKSISQVENYIDKITKHSDAIRNAIRDDEGFDFQIVKPRGIVIVGRSLDLATNRTKADNFRLLNNGLKNVEIVPYDELAQRLRNTRASLEKMTEAMRKTQGKKARKKKSKGARGGAE